MTQQTITQSRYLTWLDCHMLEHYQYRVGGTGVRSTKPYLPFILGDFLHYALAKWRKTGRMQRVFLERRINKVIDEFTALGVKPEEMAKLQKELAMAQGAALGYSEANAEDHERYEFIAVEQKGTFPFGGREFAFKLDALAKEKKTGRLVLFESKFLASSGVDSYVTLPMNVQIWAYCKGVEALHGRLPDLVVYDIVIKSQLRQKASKTGGFETLPDFAERVRQQYTSERDETTQALKMFNRLPPMPIEMGLVAAAENSIKLDMQQMQVLTPTYGWNNCRGQYGTPCPFVPACIARMKGHKEGWDAPECAGMYTQKKTLYPELEDEKEDDDGKGKGSESSGAKRDGTGGSGDKPATSELRLPHGEGTVAGATEDREDFDSSKPRSRGRKARH